MPKRTDVVTVTRGEKAALGKALQRVNTLPRGRAQGPSTYRPGTTSHLLGVLTSDLKASVGWATFSQYASSTPENEAVGEDYLDDFADEKCFNWSFLEIGDMLPEGSRVTVAFAAGRYYVVDGPCPVPEPEE